MAHRSKRLSAAISLALSTTASVAAVAAATSAATTAAAVPGEDVTQYHSPIAGAVVVNPFSAPENQFGAGHRGVDLESHAGGEVRAPADGTVRFVGSVAGRSVIVLIHPDGLNTEYEPVTPTVRRGQAVAAGNLIGRVSGFHPRCPSVCLHWGARRAEEYVDPMSLLRGLGPVRLLPWDGAPD
jgi:murein DD-endopeptidase MepM/ murein hydrolase activator NlpD